jgi:hypothetical protein
MATLSRFQDLDIEPGLRAAIFPVDLKTNRNISGDSSIVGRNNLDILRIDWDVSGNDLSKNNEVEVFEDNNLEFTVVHFAIGVDGDAGSRISVNWQ